MSEVLPDYPSFSDTKMVSHTGEEYRILLSGIERPQDEPSDRGGYSYILFQSLKTGKLYIRPYNELDATMAVIEPEDEDGHRQYIKRYEIERKRRIF